MQHLSVGAYIKGVRPLTRQDLINAVGHQLDEVQFDLYPSENQHLINGRSLPNILADGTRVWVFGPEPDKRRWSAVILLTTNGIEVV